MPPDPKPTLGGILLIVAGFLVFCWIGYRSIAG